MSDDITRRNFIVVGATAAAVLAASPLRAATAPPPAVFPGYWPAVGRGRAVGRLLYSGGAAASSITTSSPSFIRTGARIRVEQLRRATASPLSVALDVYHHVDDLESKARFMAWAYDGTAHTINPSNNIVEFTVPVEIERTLDLVFTIRTAHGQARQVVAFTAGSAPEALKLNEGSYIFALGDQAPDWSALRLTNDGLKMADDSALRFDYIRVVVSDPK
jgi:hypothetical protein